MVVHSSNEDSMTTIYSEFKLHGISSEWKDSDLHQTFQSRHC